ncbi:hypothetical protein EUX98_g4179 [Antrodiella citrinella]|uniref:Uncharacterized protein n=1 Tax=Antrodiella citrinella TaxID=2447956 RepID=A0A4S4MWQ7_9APHY|nr:hypothetical protein EUX98_g4179 [Antrodiella citrinella]
MYSTLVSVALFAAAFVGSVNAVNDLGLSQPAQLVQCQPVTLTWNKATAPYDLVVVPSSDPCNTVLVDLGANHTTTSYTWNTNVKAGTQVDISLLDADGKEGWTGSITVKASNDSSCLAASQTQNSTSSAAGHGTTLVVPPSGANPTVAINPPSTTDSGAVPVGAANAGLNPHSGAIANSFNGVTVAFSVIVGVVLAASL